MNRTIGGECPVLSMHDIVQIYNMTQGQIDIGSRASTLIMAHRAYKSPELKAHGEAVEAFKLGSSTQG